jgi:fatty acid desaturase
MPIVARVDPKSVFSPEEWSHLTSRSSLRGLWLVAHAWGTIAGAIALVTLWPNPLTWLIAVMVVGTRQLGLAILMHEAAHGGLHANRAINEWVGQWLCAVPVGADLASYRSYHLQHHKFTQQPEDPDLSLSAPFPITRESYARKAIRDLTGQTFVKQRLPLFLSLFRRGNAEEEASHESFVSSGADKMARFLGLNAVMFSLFWLAGAGIGDLAIVSQVRDEVPVVGRKSRNQDVGGCRLHPLRCQNRMDVIKAQHEVREVLHPAPDMRARRGRAGFAAHRNREIDVIVVRAVQ